MITYSLDYVTTFFDYVRISGWAFSAGTTLTSLKLSGADSQPIQTKLGLPSPDVQIGEHLRFTLSALWPGFMKQHHSLELRFSDGTSHQISLGSPAARMDPSQHFPGFDRFLAELDARKSVSILEIGARNRTGNILRHHFPEAAYVGLDIVGDENVHLIADAHHASKAAGCKAFDGVLSVNTFEHLAMPWKVALEINNLLKPGGIGFVASHQTLGLHELPTDFWRFGDASWHALFNPRSGFEVLSTYLGAPNFIIPFDRACDPTYSEATAGFAASSVVFRKIGETDLRWDVEPSDIPVGPYASTGKSSSIICQHVTVKRSGVLKLEWVEPAKTLEGQCPVCTHAGAQLEMIRSENSRTWLPLSLLKCPACASLYWTDFLAEEPNLTSRDDASTAFYITQSAGLHAMIKPLLPLINRPGLRFLEIGCGFGLALDICRVLAGWQVTGIDPSPLARDGARALKVEILPAMISADRFIADDPDIIYGSELIEHLADPLPFLQQCKHNLRPDGVMVLRTPAAEAIRPETADQLLRALLSPGDHHVLFSQQGLETALRRSGFTHSLVARDADGLIAYASCAPLSITGVENSAESVFLLAYLEKALARDMRDNRLVLGLRSRYFKELVHRGRYREALPAYGKLCIDFQRCYGAALTIPLPEGLRRELLAQNLTISETPWCLPNILYCRGMIALNDGGDFTLAYNAFTDASTVARCFAEGRSMTGRWDAETEAVERSAPYHAMLALCHLDPVEASKGLIKLWKQGDATLEAVASARQRLINLGHLEAARDVWTGCGRPAGWDGTISVDPDPNLSQEATAQVSRPAGWRRIFSARS